MENSTKKTIEIVVPILNEEIALKTTIPTLAKYCNENLSDYNWKITIGDCGSWDRSKEVVEGYNKKGYKVGYYNTGIAGRGRVLDYLWKNSKADYVCYIDSDLTIQVNHLSELVSQLNKGADFVIGSRNIKGAVSVNRGIGRTFASKLYILITRLLHNVKFTDAQCGFKGAKASSYRKLSEYIDDNSWFWDTELLLLAEKTGANIREIPVTCVYDDKSTVNVSKTAILDVLGLIRMKVSAPWERMKNKRRTV